MLPFLTLVPAVPTVDTVAVAKACKLPKLIIGRRENIMFTSAVLQFYLVVGWEVLLDG